MKARVSELYYEELGEAFDHYISPYDAQQRRRLIAALLPQDAATRTCIEIGCGTGSISESIKSWVATLTVSDLSAKMAEMVGERLDCPWSQQDACHITLPSESVDLVISSECIEHTPSPLDSLSEMARIVRPGGYVLITTPNKLWYPVMRTAQLAGIRKFQGNEIWLWPHEAIQTFQRCGLQIREVRGCHLFPWQLPLAKRLLPKLDGLGRWLYRFMINFGILAYKPTQSISENP